MRNKTSITIAVLIGSLAALSVSGQVHSSGSALAPPNDHSSSDYPSPSPTLHPHDYTPPPSPPPTRTVRGTIGQFTLQTPTPNATAHPSITPFHPNPYDASSKPTSTVLPTVSPYPTVPFEPTVTPRDPTLSTERAVAPSSGASVTPPNHMWHDARPPSPTPGGTSVPHATHGVAVEHNGSFSSDPPVGGTPGGLTVNDPPEPTPRPTRAAMSQVEPESMTAERQSQAPGGAVPVATPYFPVDPAITPSGHHVRPAPSAAAKLAPGSAMPVATPYYPVDPDTHPHSGNVDPAPGAAARPTPNSTLTTSGGHMGPPRKVRSPRSSALRESHPRNTGVTTPTPPYEPPVPPKDPTTSTLRQSGPARNGTESGNHPRRKRPLLRQPLQSPTPGPSVHPTKPPRNPKASPQ